MRVHASLAAALTVVEGQRNVRQSEGPLDLKGRAAGAQPRTRQLSAFSAAVARSCWTFARVSLLPLPARVGRARACSVVLLCSLSVAATRPPREYEQPHRTLTLKCDVGLRSQNVTSLPH